MSFDTVIFDLDGTLLNTLEDLKDSINIMLRHFKCREITLNQAREYVGNGAKNLIKKSLPFIINDIEADKYLKVFRESYDNNKISKTKPYQGIYEMLDTLKKHNTKMAIVSNKYCKAVRELNDLFFKDYIDIAIGEQQGINKKPAPDMVFLALAELYKDRLNKKKNDENINFEDRLLIKSIENDKISDIGLYKNNSKSCNQSEQVVSNIKKNSLDYKNLVPVRSVLIERYAINLKKCVYVGDSEVDIETAKNAGLKCISVTWGFRDRDKLEYLNPYKIIDNPFDLGDLILNTKI